MRKKWGCTLSFWTSTVAVSTDLHGIPWSCPWRSTDNWRHSTGYRGPSTDIPRTFHVLPRNAAASISTPWRPMALAMAISTAVSTARSTTISRQSCGHPRKQPRTCPRKHPRTCPRKHPRTCTGRSTETPTARPTAMPEDTSYIMVFSKLWN